MDGGPHGMTGRVLQVMEPSEGGVLDHVVVLSAGLVARGWAVEVATRPRSAVRPALEEAGAVVHEIAFDRGPHGYPMAARQLRSLDRRRGFDLVHAHSSKAGGLVRATLPDRRRLVYTPHCFAFLAEFGRLRQSIYRVAEQCLLSRTGRVVAACDWEREEAARRLAGLRGRAAVIEYGVPSCEPSEPAEELLAFKGDRPLAGFVGRLEPQKDPVALVRAVGVLRERGPVSGRFAVVGNGSLRAAVEEEIDRRGLRDVVRCFAFRRPVARYLRACELLVLPSRWEALPIAMLEAMACGLPVVATAVAAIPDVIDQGVTGIVVPKEDDAALAQALTVLADGGRLTTMGTAARDLAASRFGVERMVQETVDLYRRVLAEP